MQVRESTTSPTTSRGAATEVLLQPRESQGPIPLSAQQSLGLQWLSQQQGINFKLRGTAIRILGQLDATALSRSLDAMVRRHEALRTRIVAVDGIHRQHVDPPAADSLQSIDLSHESAAEAWRQAKSIESAIYSRAVDVALGPLFEAKLLKFSDCEHALIMVLNHLISDAVSCEILNRELWALYAQARQGVPMDLPPVGLQYGDYSVWQGGMHELWRMRHEAYWRGRFQNAVAPRIPMESFVQAERPVGAKLYFGFGSRLSEQLRDLARCKQVSLPSLVLVTYAAAMSHWCDQQDLVVFLTSHGRQRLELKHTLGFFAHPLGLRLELAPRDSFLDLLNKIAAERAAADQHRDYCAHFRPECGTDVTFNWLPANSVGQSSYGTRAIDRRLRIQPFPASFSWPLPFESFFSEGSADIGVGMTVHYRPDRLATTTVRRFGEDMRKLAEALVSSPAKRVRVTTRHLQVRRASRPQLIAARTALNH